MKTSMIIRRLAAVLSAVSLCVLLALPAQAQNSLLTDTSAVSALNQPENVIQVQSTKIKKKLVSFTGIGSYSAAPAGSKTVYADLTGDNIDDEIEISYAGAVTYDYLDWTGTEEELLKITVNGTHTRTIDLQSGTTMYKVYSRSSNHNLSIYYIRQSKNKEFIYVCANDPALGYTSTFARIYQYNNDTGKLKCVLNIDKIMYADDWNMNSVVKFKLSSVTKNKITVDYEAEYPQTGDLEYSYSYVYKNGRFVQSPKQTKATSYFKDNKLVTSKKLKLYKSPGSKKLAVTVKKGETVKLKKIASKNGKTYAKFSYGKKSGWVEIGYDNWSGKDWFEGVVLEID